MDLLREIKTFIHPKSTQFKQDTSKTGSFTFLHEKYLITQKDRNLPATDIRFITYNI